MNKADVYAKQKTVHISFIKVKPVMDLVRGKDLEEAKLILAFTNRKAAKILLKVLKSAEANAKNNSNLNPNTLYIKDVRVNEGPTLKRGHFVGRGRFNPILKRTSHIVVGLSERKAE